MKTMEELDAILDGGIAPMSDHRIGLSSAGLANGKNPHFVAKHSAALKASPKKQAVMAVMRAATHNDATKAKRAATLRATYEKHPELRENRKQSLAAYARTRFQNTTTYEQRQAYRDALPKITKRNMAQLCRDHGLNYAHLFHFSKGRWSDWLVEDE